MIDVSIVIPCYNEFLNLEHIVRRCEEIRNENKQFNFEFVLVNNGSTDDTSLYFNKLKRKNFKVVTIKKNIGYGNGIIQGLNHSSYDILAWTHADLQTDISDIVEGIKFLKRPITLVKGKRVSRKLIPKSLSLGMSLYVYFKLGLWVNEINAQPKIFTKKFFLSIKHNVPNDFSLDLFFCIHAKKKGKIKEYPVYFNKRLYESAKGGGGTFSQKVKIIKRTIEYVNKLKV